MSASIDLWLEAAVRDAERRGLPELKPLLEGMARSTTALRAADAELEARERRDAEAAEGADSPRHLPPRA